MPLPAPISRDCVTDFSRGTLSASVGGGLLDTVNATNGAAANVAASQSFGLDSLGNTAALTTNGTASQTRTADSQNELLTLQNGTNASVSLTYDNNGNMLTDEAGQTYVYDPWNRLHSVSNASITRTFTYDGLHRGAVSVADTSGSTSVRELYYSNDWQVIEEREDAFSSTAPLEQNIWGLGYVDSLARGCVGRRNLRSRWIRLQNFTLFHSYLTLDISASIGASTT